MRLATQLEQHIHLETWKFSATFGIQYGQLKISNEKYHIQVNSRNLNDLEIQ